jgi:hypothetical protein
MTVEELRGLLDQFPDDTRIYVLTYDRRNEELSLTEASSLAFDAIEDDEKLLLT